MRKRTWSRLVLVPWRECEKGIEATSFGVLVVVVVVSQERYECGYSPVWGS